MTKPSPWILSQLVFWAFADWESDEEMSGAGDASLAITRKLLVTQAAQRHQRLPN